MQMCRAREEKKEKSHRRPTAKRPPCSVATRMGFRPPPGVVALGVVMFGAGGIVWWVHEGQKRERVVRFLSFARV